MNKSQFDKLVVSYPSRHFCLHNGFAGFSYGSPSNPVWISNERAYEILLRYEELTKINPLADFDKTWYIYTLIFSKDARPLEIETGFRMIGFNEEKECLYGTAGGG